MARFPYVLGEEFLFAEKREGFEMSGSEARHLITVLRAREGYQFVIFDGKGRGCLAEVAETRNKGIIARIIKRLDDEKPQIPRLILAVGVVKGNRMDWAVEKAAEIGADNFIPLITEFTVVEPKKGKVDRWRGIALAAAKQSRRKWLMSIEEPMSIDELLNKSDPPPTLILDTSKISISLEIYLINSSSESNLRLIIGPEGGFSEREKEIFRGKKLPLISIGSNPLRTETAVAVSTGIIRAHFSGGVV